MLRMTISVALLLLLFTVASSAQFTEWSAPVRLGPPVNSNLYDDGPIVSKDGLSLYFSRGLSGAPDLSDYELMVSTRTSVDEPWGPPVRLTAVNSSGYVDGCARLSLDEHRLYFCSTRPGGCGATGTYDLWVSRRQDRRDNSGWEAPVNLGCQVNGASNDLSPSFFEDESGAVVMYFASNRIPSQGIDIFESRMQDDGTFGPATPVSELNTAPFTDRGTAIRRDGLEIIVESNRAGTLGFGDLWTATRESTRDPWSALMNLTTLNTAVFDGGAVMGMSFDGRTLYFLSSRDFAAAGYEIYVTTRERLHGKKK